MKCILIFSLFIILFSFHCQAMKRKLLSRYENLQKEIFMKKFYRDYSFELIKQIPAKDPINQKVFDTLLAQGMQKYCRLAVDWNAQKNGELKSFEEYSLSELESIR